MTRCVVENRHQKYTCSNEIRLCALHVDAILCLNFYIIWEDLCNHLKRKKKRIFLLSSCTFNIEMTFCNC